MTSSLMAFGVQCGIGIVRHRGGEDGVCRVGRSRNGLKRNGVSMVMEEVKVGSPMEVPDRSLQQRREDFDRHVMRTYGRFPVMLERGSGARLWDVDGREWLDFVAGIATCTLGHADPRLIEAVTRQMSKLHHVSNLYYNESQGELAAWLVEHSPADRVFFCNSGAEANEAAIKLTRKFASEQNGVTDPVIVTANASFHGRTLATITATAQPKYQKGFAPLVPGFVYTPYNDIEALEQTIASVNAQGNRLGGILLEALQGEGGVRPGDRAFFAKVRDICNRSGAVMMMDEVQVGVGRTGKLWGFENLGVEPDVFTLAKGLAGGVPIGAMLCKEPFNVFSPGDHASTFGGNPLACSAGLAVTRALVEEGVLVNAEERGKQLRDSLEQLQATFSIIQEVRGWGLIQGIELVPGSVTAADVVNRAMEKGLLLASAGQSVVRLVPPLIVTSGDVDQALSILEETLSELAL